jgi:hypothetical protein
MQNLFELQENKVTTNLGGYSMVLMAETGEGKTYTLNQILRIVNWNIITITPLSIKIKQHLTPIFSQQNQLPMQLASKVGNVR